jgi:hypothetical protein
MGGMRRLGPIVALLAACTHKDPRVERGRYLANGILQCFMCHAPRDPSKPGWPPIPDRLGAGALIWQDGERHMYAPNITPDAETGAGTWTDQQLADAIARGVGHDGRTLSLPMYWTSFRYLADDDLAAVIAYLRTLTPIRSPIPPRALEPEREKQLAATTHPPRSPVAPPADDPVARGKYFLKIADCGGCHSSWEAPVNAGFLAGGNLVDREGRSVFSANITPSPSGIGSWTRGQFIAALRSGAAPGHTLDPIMPWVALRNLTDDDLGAIHAALLTMRPVAHAISNYDPPTDCPRCRQKHGLGDHNGPKLLAAMKLDDAALDALAGRYRLDDGGELALQRDGDRLLATLPGLPPLPLLATSPTELDADFLPSPARIERDARGAVTRLVSRWIDDDVAERIGP